jgi:protoporphyrinogen oxidase
LGTVLILLFLKKPLTRWVYWLNINDENIPFVGCIEHSNLINKSFYHNLHPIYLVAYTSNKSRLFKQKNKEIFQKWIPHLKKINKNFKTQWIKDYQVIKEPLTQPVFKIESYQYVPELQTSIKNLYLANTSQTYPWDRSVNYAVVLGKKVTQQLLRGF